MNGYKVVAAVFLSTVACGDDVTEPEPLYPATVAVSPETGETKTFADTIHLTATVRDQNGDIMDSVSVKWSTGDTLVATVSAKGIVTAWRGGVVLVRATAGRVSDTATITVDLVQRDVLLKFYESLNGDDWTENRNWGTRTTLDTWYGVETDEEGNVSRLNLGNNGLRGEIPSDVKLLEHLRVLDLSFNYFIEGPIPLEIGELENLTGLLLHHNAMTGPIPSVIANLTNLDSLDIHHNQLTGPVPEWLGDLSQLRILRLWGNNDLTGSVPASLGNLSHLTWLDFYDTNLSGQLPRSLTNLRLRGFYWHDTFLCSPPDDEFQDWLKTIPNTRGHRTCDQ